MKVGEEGDLQEWRTNMIVRSEKAASKRPMAKGEGAEGAGPWVKEANCETQQQSDPSGPWCQEMIRCFLEIVPESKGYALDLGQARGNSVPYKIHGRQ